jgi:hypothetical protein
MNDLAYRNDVLAYRHTLRPFAAGALSIRKTMKYV